jgi:hypothetical protein
MAVQSSPVLPQSPKIAVTQLSSTATAVSLTSSTYTTLYTGGTNGSKITGVMASNTSTGAAINAILTIGSTVSGAQLYYQVASATLPALTSAFDTVITSVNLFGNTTIPLPLDGDGNPYLFLASTAYTLSVGVSSAPQTTNGRVNFVAIGADF